MKRTKLVFIMFIVTLLMLFSCSKDSTGPDNLKPEMPSNPNPENNANLVSTNTDLSWSCIDPENNPLTFDVYFGTSSNPPLVNSGLSNTIFNPGTLFFETTYYWKIVAYDGHSNSTNGEIWQFTTYDGGGNNFDWCTVPAGEYTYSYGDSIKSIDYDYQIMKFEVTNQQYVNYLEEAMITGNIVITSSSVEGYYTGDDNYNAGTYLFLDISFSGCRIGWSDSTFTIDPGYEEYPVVYVTWFGSWVFAEHYDFSLPTEQEWEKAARGNTGYDYPWGDDINGSRANYYNSGDPWDNAPTPVGIYNGQMIQGFSTTNSTSPYGVYDMAGNVWNWTNSWWSSNRVIRGGSYNNNTDKLRSWYRSNYPPTGYNQAYGFRCVNK